MSIFNFRNSVNSSISMNGNSVKVNGETIKVPNGASVSVVNGKVFINGEEYKSDPNIRYVSLTIEGNCGDVESDGNVTVNGSANNIQAGGNISCEDVYMNVRAGGNVKCGNVKNVQAGGNVSHR